MNFRAATEADLSAVAELYDAIHTEEEAGRAEIGWIRGVYPTRATAEDALRAGSLYVLEDAGAICAAAKLDQTQVDVYAQAEWAIPARAEEVLVLHTLVVHPKAGRRGYGKAFVAFYEAEARRRGCRALRLDTNARNRAARRLYASLGYREASILPCEFNGIPGVELVCLEKGIY